MLRRLSGSLALACTLLVLCGAWYLLARPQAVDAPELRAGKKLQCVSYAPFRKNQSPFDLEHGLVIPNSAIEADLTLLAQRFDCVRTYSVAGLEAVPEIAEKLGLEVLLGAWVSSDPVATRKELTNVIALAKQHPGTIRAVIVGNEALLRKEVTAKQLANYIREVKQALPFIPVTYADVWEFWLKNPEIALTTDFVTIHILPYWEDKPTPIGKALAHIKKVRRDVEKQIPGKDILIGETGWPSAGRMRQGALPDIKNQALFIRGFIRMAEAQGWQYNLIEAFDQPWKRVNEGTVGGFWGLYDTHRADKGVLIGNVTRYPSGWLLPLLSLLTAALSLPILHRCRSITYYRWATLALTIPAGALLLTLQFWQFSVSARSSLEYGWAGLVLTLSLICYLLVIHAIASGVRERPASISRSLSTRIGGKNFFTLPLFNGQVQTGLLLCAFAETLGLIFDARYRSFNNSAFLVPALAYAVLFTKDAKLPEHQVVERGLGLLLIAGALFVLFNETPLNLQADLWVVINLALAYPLLRNSRGTRLPPMKTLFIAAFAAYVTAAGLRYGLMESSDMAERCATVSSGGLCSTRSAIGLMIHFGLFGWISLAAAALALLVKKKVLLVVTTIMSILGLTLYNTNLSVIAVLLLAIAWSRLTFILPVPDVAQHPWASP